NKLVIVSATFTTMPRAQRSPAVGNRGRLNMRRHHSHHTIGLAFQPNSTAENRRIRREDRFPEFVTENYGVWSVRRVLLLCEGSAHQRLDAEHIKVSSGDTRVFYVAGLVNGLKSYALCFVIFGSKAGRRDVVPNQFPGFAVLPVVNFVHNVSLGSRAMQVAHNNGKVLRIGVR